MEEAVVAEVVEEVLVLEFFLPRVMPQVTPHLRLLPMWGRIYLASFPRKPIGNWTKSTETTSTATTGVTWMEESLTIVVGSNAGGDWHSFLLRNMLFQREEWAVDLSSWLRQSFEASA